MSSTNKRSYGSGFGGETQKKHSKPSKSTFSASTKMVKDFNWSDDRKRKNEEKAKVPVKYGVRCL